MQIGIEENDTVKVFEELGSAYTPEKILNVMSTIHGPWSFAFWQVIYVHRLQISIIMNGSCFV